MAANSLVLRFETDLARDAISDLALVLDRVRHRHGDRFRALERRVEGLSDGRFTLPEFKTLNDGTCVFGVPPEMAALLNEARDLGVI